MGIVIRSAQAKDLGKIVSFQIEMARLTEERALSQNLVGRGVKAVIDNPQLGFYLIAEWEGEVQASLLVTREWSDWRAGWFWWIQSVFVTPSFRNQGLYRALHNRVKSRAQEAGDVVGLRLYVETENQSAMEVYRRMGMVETNYRIYEEEW
jgi:GNAT superfamily N-acetyltransferase